MVRTIPPKPQIGNNAARHTETVKKLRVAAYVRVSTETRNSRPVSRHSMSIIMTTSRITLHGNLQAYMPMTVYQQFRPNTVSSSTK